MKYTSQSHVWEEWTPAVGTVWGSHEAIGTIVCGQIWSIEIESYPCLNSQSRGPKSRETQLFPLQTDHIVMRSFI